jgi:hypothetical protein
MNSKTTATSVKLTKAVYASYVSVCIVCTVQVGQVGTRHWTRRTQLTWAKLQHHGCENFKYLPKFVVSIMNPAGCTFHSVYWESTASTCFEHYLLILRWRYTKALGILRACYVSWLRQGQSQLTFYARNIPNAVCVAPPEDEQVMLETCRDSWFSINWIRSASRWFHYTCIL